MGWVVKSIKLSIPQASEQDCLAAFDNTHGTLVDLVESTGLGIELKKGGVYKILNIHNDLRSDIDSFLHAIAPFVVNGSYITIKGEGMRAQVYTFVNRSVRVDYNRKFLKSLTDKKYLATEYPVEPILPELVKCEAGSIKVLGSFFYAGDSGYSVKPIKDEIVIKQPFYIGVFPVTYNEFGRYCSATNRLLPYDGDFGMDNRPVINVTIEDTLGYCHWLSGITGDKYRLPTENEWFYAANAGNSKLFWWGNAASPKKVWCVKNTKSTQPVGQLEPNPWGLHDVLGNVFEFTTIPAEEDRAFLEYADNMFTGKEVEENSIHKPLYTARGGGWRYSSPRCSAYQRLAWYQPPDRYRLEQVMSSQSDSIGFRIVKEI